MKKLFYEYRGALTGKKQESSKTHTDMQYRVIAKFAQETEGKVQKFQKAYIIKSDTEMGVYEKFHKYAEENRMSNLLIKQISLINFDSIELKENYERIYHVIFSSTVLDETSGKEVFTSCPALVGCDSAKEAIEIIESKYNDAKVRSVRETGIADIIE
jgi:hypothetical protein